MDNYRISDNQRISEVFRYLGKGGNIVLLRTGKLVATGQIKKTEKVVACFYCMKTSTYVLSKSFQMGYDPLVNHNKKELIT